MAHKKREAENTINGNTRLLEYSSKKAAQKGPAIDAILLVELHRPTAVFLTCIGKVSGVIAYWTGYKMLIQKK